MADNHRVNRSTRASVFEIENLSRVPGYACRSCNWPWGLTDVALDRLILPPLEDDIYPDHARAKAINAFAVKEGFSGGFPTFHQAGDRYGAILLKKGIASQIHVPWMLLNVFGSPNFDFSPFFDVIREELSLLGEANPATFSLSNPSQEELRSRLGDTVKLQYFL